MKGKCNFLSYLPSSFGKESPFSCFDCLLFCNICRVYETFLFLNLKLKKNPSPQETTAQARGKPQSFYRSTYTWGIRLWGSPQCGHSLCLFYAENT